MCKKKGLLRTSGLVLGILSILIFLLSFIFFEGIRPRMITFGELTSQEDTLLTGMGFGLLLILCFYFVSLWQIVRYLRYVEKITFPYVLLLVTGVLTFLFIFADVALLQDIVKQYHHGLAQPEWTLVYPVMAFQALVALVFLYLHFKRAMSQSHLTKIAKDSNIFMVVQYVGVICGAIGLAFTSLGFLFPHAWTLTVHTIMSSLILIFPYILAIIYWFVIKVNEKDKELYDEKQVLDVGKSAFLTMIISSAVMIVLFITNFRNLEGIISVIWLPLLLFTEVLVFSFGNVYFSHRI